MKKLFALSLVGSSLLFVSNSAKADWDKWGIKSSRDLGISVYTINSSTGVSTLKGSYCGKTESYDPPGPELSATGCVISIGSDSFVRESNGNFVFDYESSNLSELIEFDIETNTFKEVGDNYLNDYLDESIHDRKVISGGLINGNSELSIDGKKMMQRKSDGSIHIGENSAVFKEEGGREKFWAQDANGKSIPIDITNGSKLLINGRDVEQSINNVGALSAALTGLPTVPTDTTLACGLGTGTHGGDFAFSGGCASKVNEKLSINYAASMTMPGQDYAGDFEDTFSARAGFVWKLGKTTKPTQISMKETRELKEEIADLKENNKNIIAQNNALLARLERLEKVALGDLKSKDLAVFTLK